MSTTQRNLQQKELKPPFFDLDQLGERWHCHRLTAYRRLQRLGVKPIKLSDRSLLFRMSDIVQIEDSCI
jgi:hypothetical protein